MQKELYRLMLKYNFKPNSKFDQNFMVDKKFIDYFVELTDIKENETILEIGPGTGFLTKELLKKAKKVIVIEKDKIMTDILDQEIKSKKLEIINESILDVDLEKIKFDKIVGFIPYSISSKILEKIGGTKKANLVVQKEFAQKLTSSFGFEDYNYLTVLLQSYGDIVFRKNIKKSSFFPSPKVESAMISIFPKNHKIDNNYLEFLKTLFRYSKKDLANAINFSKKINPKIFSKIDINKIDQNLLKKKVKIIDVDEFIKIYTTFF